MSDHRTAPQPARLGRALGRRQLIACTAGAWLARPGAAHAAGITALRIGAARGPQAELMSVAAGLARARGLTLEIVTADDRAALLAAVRRGDLHATASHNAVELNQLPGGAGLMAAFATVTLPTGIYSRRVNSIVKLRDGDPIVLPGLGPDRDRATVLLYNYGLLFAHEDDGLSPDLSNVVNPRHFLLRAAATGELAGHLRDAAAVLLPYPAAIAAGLRPGTDSIGLEDGKSPYTQVVAVRAADRGRPWLATLAQSFQSRELRRVIYQRYGESVRPPW